MKGAVHYSVDGDIATLLVDNPPVNPLSSGVRQGFQDGIKQATADDNVKVVVVTGKGRSFIAGADISEFGGKAEGPGLHDIMSDMENCPKPVVAIINGSALGGGLEVALVCHYRVILPTGFVGLPEVNLGLLPGAGGTQRLPRIIGPGPALQVMLGGGNTPAQKALDAGIVDAFCQSYDEAIAKARELAAQGPRRVRDMTPNVGSPEEAKAAIDAAKKMVAKSRRGQFAPQQIIKCVEKAVENGDFDAGLKFEGERFVECLTNPQREAMIHIFFSQRQAARIADLPKDEPTQDVKSACVVGAGLMGGGITMNFLQSGVPVTLLDRAQEDLDKGVSTIRTNYERMVKGGRMSQKAMDKAMSLLTPSLDYGSIGDVDLAIEAVYENMDLKQEIFKKLDASTKDDAVLASNTSFLDIDQIGSVVKNPSRVVGMHFFSPANIMQLLEVVRGKNTGKKALATAMAMAKRIRKIGVVAGNCPGFIGNRMISAYSTQANKLILEGALPSQVDRVLREDIGMAMGPFQMSDLVGLDLGWRARKMRGDNGNDQTRIGDTLCEQDRLGQKNGKGFYNYAPGSRAPMPAPEADAVVVKVSEDLGYKRRDISDQEILERCLFALVNEGAKIIDEGHAQRASDIDVVYVFGYGFPVWRGGPMKYAEQTGLSKVVEQMQHYGKSGDASFDVSPYLKAKAEGEGRF